MNRKRSAFAVCLTMFLCVPVVQGSETVHVVLDRTAPRLEKFAAQELAGQLTRVFDGMVVVRESPGTLAARTLCAARQPRYQSTHSNAFRP